MRCSSLTDPNNGMMNCSVAGDGTSSYEYTCNFTCNNDYKLIGSDTRTCQSNGSWSGSDVVCKRGTYVCTYLRMSIYNECVRIRMLFQ